MYLRKKVVILHFDGPKESKFDPEAVEVKSRETSKFRILYSS